MKISVIICAAGKGERAGFNKNKLLAPLFGAPALWHTLRVFSKPRFDEVIVVSSKRDEQEISALCAPFGFKTVIGGETRTASVYNALKRATGEIALIHDGARPFVNENIILNCINGVKKYGSAICAAPFTDTAAMVEDGKIISVPQRKSVYSLQTPQGFYLKDILSAYEKAVRDGNVYTDDSSVYAAYIGEPHICEGSEGNKKLTYAQDFNCGYGGVIEVTGLRTGFGVDVHSFGKEQNFVTLCGVEIPCDSGLIAHSDGDVAVHAVMDALLSAAGLKDIGHYFPVDDERFDGADSLKLLAQVISLLAESGFKASGLSLAIQAEKPRLAPYINQMKQKLAKACSLPEEKIGVTAGTSEGLGFVGEGRGICAYCTAVLKEIKDGEN